MAGFADTVAAPMARARRRHLGGARRHHPPRALQADGLARLGPRTAHRRAPPHLGRDACAGGAAARAELREEIASLWVRPGKRDLHPQLRLPGHRRCTPDPAAAGVRADRLATVPGTIDAIVHDLDAGAPLLYRYPPGHDGLPGIEGAFLPCSFWLVQALARSRTGRRSDVTVPRTHRAGQPGRALRRGDGPAHPSSPRQLPPGPDPRGPGPGSPGSARRKRRIVRRAKRCRRARSTAPCAHRFGDTARRLHATARNCPRTNGCTGRCRRRTEQTLAIRTAMPRELRAMVTLGAGTGLRQSEVFGLTLDRLDFLRRTVTVDRQVLTHPGRGPAFGPPKTKASVYRTIPLPQVVTDELAEHLAAFPALARGAFAGLEVLHREGAPWTHGQRFGDPRHLQPPVARLGGPLPATPSMLRWKSCGLIADWSGVKTVKPQVRGLGADGLAHRPGSVHRAASRRPGWRPSISGCRCRHPPATYPRARADHPRTLAVWSCSRWGLPSHDGRPSRWWSLAPPFHPYPRPESGGGLFSVALIPRVTPGGRYPPPRPVEPGPSSTPLGINPKQ